jgi:hypothetical protein
LELRPYHGRTWAPVHHPDRLRATYTRTQGTLQWLAFWDTRCDYLWGYFYRRKRSKEVLLALRKMRRRYPLKERIYLILDNFSPHKRPEVLRWAKQNNVVLIWTPTNASWLNHIEPRFTDLKEFGLENSDYRTHDELKAAFRDYLKYRNAKKSKHKIT